MGNNPLDTKRISKIGLVGAMLGGFGVLLFVGLWLLLGEAGFDSFPRLMASLCIPPAIIAAIMGVYMLIFKPYQPPSE